ncbi:MAG: 2-oxo acid dehydrogenase subunit E2 [Polyangiaceae bacterium]|nr:2-oxo acid dehydrogenase subunit E2 [Polyangiaceae bacterium]
MLDVKVPQVGESVTEGTIAKWLVSEGDIVQEAQAIAELATDKTDAEVSAPAAGRIGKLLVNEGDVVPVGSVICQIEEGVTAPAAAPKAAPAAPAAQPAAAVPQPPAAVHGSLGPLASPTARRAALEQGVNLGDVHGSGERGRITRDDVLRAVPTPHVHVHAESQPAVPAPQPVSPNVAGLAQMIHQGGGFVPPIPGVGFGSFKVPAYRQNPADKIIPFTRRRRITADHMTYSKFASPHVVTVAECDIFRSARLREAHKDRYKKEGMSLTMLAFVVVAVARALRENPTMNARVLDDAFVIFKDVNIGVAVDSPDGLVVPVVRHADDLGVRGIVRAIDDLALRARTGKITVDDLSGATFSVTNPGLKGNLFGGAIINQPNVGILRMGEIKKRAVVVEGADGDQIAIHPVMYMALSYDHRIVDGVAANSFLWRVREILEKAEFDV